MDSIIFDILVGVTQGGLYFLTAAGLVLIMGITRVVNFAHGHFYMLGAYVAWMIGTAIGSNWGYWAGCLGGAISAGLVGILVEVFFLRSLYKTEPLFQMLLLFGLLFLIEGVVFLLWGSSVLRISIPSYLMGNMSIGNMTFPYYLLFVLGASIALTLLLWLFLFKTDLGKNCRAAGMDTETAGALGINVPMVYTSLFTLGAMLAGAAGGLATGMKGVSPLMGGQMILNALIVAVIGGVGNLLGALMAAIILGITETIIGHYLQMFGMAVPFVLMAVILVIRPYGLLGRPE
ncbi:MAG: branched-chain amino acid ABC transporter permease [Deltaproteobacteria bacterium]|nr:branched-chain amino acid ABC transporter permease [Deltaproteobacteria bacterium]